MQVRGVRGVEGPIHAGAVTTGWIPDAFEPTESERRHRTGERENTDSAKTTFDPSNAKMG